VKPVGDFMEEKKKRKERSGTYPFIVSTLPFKQDIFDLSDL
jgi:hypothetical protein